VWEGQLSGLKRARAGGAADRRIGRREREPAWGLYTFLTSVDMPPRRLIGRSGVPRMVWPAILARVVGDLGACARVEASFSRRRRESESGGRGLVSGASIVFSVFSVRVCTTRRVPTAKRRSSWPARPLGSTTQPSATRRVHRRPGAAPLSPPPLLANPRLCPPGPLCPPSRPPTPRAPPPRSLRPGRRERR